MTEEIVGLLETEWASITELCSTLTPEDWDLPTDLPGWTVRDNLSHVIGTERMLLGDHAPDGFADATKGAHVKNAIGEANEIWVASMRPLPGPEVLDAFTATTERRRAALNSMTAADFDKEGWSPVGTVPYREFMAIRLMDSWAHEQDIRRAVGKPGHLTGGPAQVSLGRVVSSLPFVIGKKAAAPEASVVVIELTGPIAKTVVVVVENGRAKFAHSDDAEGGEGAALPQGFDHDAATCVLTMSSEALCCLGFGRWDPRGALEGGTVSMAGDRALAEAVTEALPLMI